MKSLSPRLLALALLAAAAAACGEGITGVSSPSRPTRRLLRGEELAAVQLVQCPSSSTLLDALGVVGSRGGDVDGEQVRVHVPIAAVDEITGIAVFTPESEFMEVEFRAGASEHYTFDRLITVQIDYSRCPTSSITSHEALRVVYIDPVTKQPLEDMGGVVDSVARTITFETGHFSSYAVAD